METLPTNLQKLIAENAAAVRETLRKVRKSGQAETFQDRNGKTVTIKPLRRIKPLRQENPAA